ncbi:MAG: GNAT family N-acetyltransferase [Oscillospiraceae bacterium]|nr:GNAT family N-acetyltransferase [Oscillospiraceae bacterium]
MYLFKEVVKEESSIFDSWLKHESVNKWLGGIDNWFDYFEFANANPDYFLIKVLLENNIVGVIMLEITGETGYISLTINPVEQHKGHGKRILSLFLQQIHKIIKRDIKYIESGIFPDNIVSRRCFESCGFKFTENGEDGEMIYIYNL